MPIVRVFYDPGTLRCTGIEYRVDEPQLGAAAYTDANRPENHNTESWFTTDSTNRLDPGGDVVPVSFCRVNNADPQNLQLNIDAGWTAEKTKRADRQDGRLSALYAKLEDDSITPAEIRELLRLERALN